MLKEYDLLDNLLEVKGGLADEPVIVNCEGANSGYIAPSKMD